MLPVGRYVQSAGFLAATCLALTVYSFMYKKNERKKRQKKNTAAVRYIFGNSSLQAVL